MDTTSDVTVSAAQAIKDPVERVQAYRLAKEALKLGRADALALGNDPLTREVGGQLLRATGSIAANIAEGYSRGTTADRRKFLEYALGSVRECLVWYEAADHADREEREARLISIRRLLLTMIRTSRLSSAADQRKFEK
ncbi:MAG TPA: four helix bundle protein [Gemmatimonadaceae bacterium]|nr:four helix bundle protein [Gemmatimonadaceae bacterium]